VHSTGNEASPLPNGERELVVAHTSDLHLGGRVHRGGPLDALQAVLEAAAETHSDVLLLVGDVFDSHRASASVVEGAVEMLVEAGIPVIILPGNHDPLTPDAVYRRAAFAEADVHVLGLHSDGSVLLAELELEISGVPHLTYADMSPLALRRDRTAKWRVVVAHGHWHRGSEDSHRGWLIPDHELAAIDADYIALGHWDVPQPAGDGSVAAYYSGSPELARTINIARIGADRVDVSRHPLRLAHPAR
jgi:DNA repair exonuclease SbcCD nuclease subunit